MKKRLALLLAFLVLSMSIQTFHPQQGFAETTTPATVGTGVQLPEALEARVSESVILYLGSNLARNRGTLTPIDIGRNGTAPFLQDNRTMVPIRFLAESVGGKVGYDAVTRTATVTIEGFTIQVRDGDKALRINGTPIQMPVAPVARNGRLYAPLRAISEAFGMGVFYDRGLIVIAPGKIYLNAATHKAWIDEQIRALGMVQVAKSEAELLTQLQAWQKTRYGTYAPEFPPMMADEAPQVEESKAGESATSGTASNVAPNPAPRAPSNDAAESTSDGHSTTNIQVAGVDEGDILKTDGTYLYQINRMRVLIIRALPADKMELLSTIQLGSENISPEEIYVADGRLTIIGSQYQSGSSVGWPQFKSAAIMDQPVADWMPDTEWMQDTVLAPSSSERASIEPSIGIMPPIRPVPSTQTTRVVTYDVSNPAAPVRTGSYEIEGRLLSSRRIGDELYLVTNKSLYYGMQYPHADTPVYRYGTGTSEGTWKRVEPTTVSWCPDFTQANYLVVSGISLSKPSVAPSLYTLMGAGETIYATADSLFVAVQQYKSGNILFPDDMMRRSMPPYSESTDIYRFTLDAGAATLVSRGTVPGRLLNQFSMDWHENHLRVATTIGWASQTGEPTSTNQLYTLDGMMNMTGAILNIAPGEQIYSTRFLGDRGYMVTYRSVDPLYVLDLADPAKPSILGELKIPGYSNYLHPYQEGYLIGFGKDAVELANNWDPGTTWAYYQGLKVALFDVTDVTKPKLMHETHIGDRGTDSELLRNHRALLFSPTRNLLAFPVNLYEVGDGNVYTKPSASDVPGSPDTATEPSVAPATEAQFAANVSEYGSFTWQGLMAYQLTLEKGFEKLAEISHLEPGDLWNTDRHVTRGAYIGNTLYTLSSREIRANSMDSWKETGRLILP